MSSSDYLYHSAAHGKEIYYLSSQTSLILAISDVFVIVSLFKYVDNGIMGLSSAVVRPPSAGAKGPGFDSPVAQHVQRLIYRVFTYGAVDSMVLNWYWARQPGFISFSLTWSCSQQVGFISFSCLWIQLRNNSWANAMCVHCALAHQAIHPFGVGKLVPAISRG